MVLGVIPSPESSLGMLARRSLGEGGRDLSAGIAPDSCSVSDCYGFAMHTESMIWFIERATACERTL